MLSVQDYSLRNSKKYTYLYTIFYLENRASTEVNLNECRLGACYNFTLL